MGNAVRSLEVAFSVLETVGRLQPVGVSDIARQLTLPKTTVQRSLEALHDLRYIVPTSEKQWMLSSRLFAFVDHLQLQASLSHAARPAMQALCDDVGETIHLTVLEHDHIVLIDLVEPVRSIRTTTRVGNTRLAHSTSGGKVLLAAKTDDELRALLPAKLEPVTTRTIATIPALLKQLAEVRRRGYAINDREYNLETTSIAAPLVDSRGVTIAAMSISAPASRLPKSKWKAHSQRVVEAANSVAI